MYMYVYFFHFCVILITFGLIRIILFIFNHDLVCILLRRKTPTVYYTHRSQCLSLPVLVYVYLSIYQLLQSIFGLLSIMAISSGYCIGSCNWIIDSDHERVTYIAGSSTLTTHPRVCRNMREHPLSIIVDLYHIIICFALQCFLGSKNITQIWRTYCYMYQNIKRHKPVIVR